MRYPRNAVCRLPRRFNLEISVQHVFDAGFQKQFYMETGFRKHVDACLHAMERQVADLPIQSSMDWKPASVWNFAEERPNVPWQLRMMISIFRVGASGHNLSKDNF